MLNLSLEIIAVITAILYLVLAAKEDVKCWYAAIISSSLYFYIMLNAGLLMEAILQVFYVGMAIYGWKQWNKLSNEQYEIRIKKWKKINHLYAVGIVVILAIISKDILEKYTNAVFPFLDALTTFGAIITTYMVAKKIIENWIYWFVIDSISIYLFYLTEPEIKRSVFLDGPFILGRLLKSILFFIYLIIIIFGYKSWNKKLKENK